MQISTEDLQKESGTNYYFGQDFFKSGMKVKLIKEPDNTYDKEAIRVELAGLGTVGYVANSPYTVQGESMSAGRLYDRMEDTAKGTVMLDCHSVRFHSFCCVLCAEKVFCKNLSKSAMYIV